MKLQNVNVDGQAFKIQEGMSFVQSSKVLNLLEEYLDFSKLEEIKKEINEDKLTVISFSQILRKDKKLMEFQFELMKFCLKEFVKEPEITDDTLNDPDDPNAENYAVLGMKLIESALKYIGKQALLKKTPTKS